MDTIALTMREQHRVTVIQRVFRGELTMAEAAMVLGVSRAPELEDHGQDRKGGRTRGNPWQSRPVLASEAASEDAPPQCGTRPEEVSRIQ